MAAVSFNPSGSGELATRPNAAAVLPLVPADEVGEREGESREMEGDLIGELATSATPSNNLEICMLCFLRFPVRCSEFLRRIGCLLESMIALLYFSRSWLASPLPSFIGDTVMMSEQNDN